METKHTPIWKSKFWKTIPNPNAPGGKVDGYIVVDDDTGEGIITIAVPHGDKQTPERVCNAVNNVGALEAALKACADNLAKRATVPGKITAAILNDAWCLLAKIAKEREG